MSTFGRVFRVTTFGESHGRAVGAVVDGVPPQLPLSEDDIQPQLHRRRPGQSRLTTPRVEGDIVTILSGTEGGVTLGTPVALMINNANTRPSDYKRGGLSDTPRPGHADYTYQTKYGIRAASGGGRSSARETAARVAAGAVAEKWLVSALGTRIVAFVSAVGDVRIPAAYADPAADGGASVAAGAGLAAPAAAFAILDRVGNVLDDAAVAVARARLPVASAPNAAPAPTLDGDELINVRCPDTRSCARMATTIREVKHAGDSTGGVLTCVCSGVPVGLGEPCFDKIEAELARAMMSLPATKGFEIGSGFAGTRLRGSQHNDAFRVSEAVPTGGGAAGSGTRGAAADSTPLLSTVTNNAGGTLGGITSGADIVFRVAIKPVSTISLPQDTVTFGGARTVLEARGRHDACPLPRAPPLVEAMAALVLADAAMLQLARASSVAAAAHPGSAAAAALRMPHAIAPQTWAPPPPPAAAERDGAGGDVDAGGKAAGLMSDGGVGASGGASAT